MSNQWNVVYVDMEVNLDPFEKWLNQSLKIARDTWKELNQELLLKLEMDYAELKVAKFEAQQTLKALQKEYKEWLVDRSKLVEAENSFKRITSELTQSQRVLENYKNTWDTATSRLQAKFNQVTYEIKKSRDELEKTWKSTSWFDKLIKKADELEREFKEWTITQQQYTKWIQDIEKALNKTNQNLNWFWFSMVKLNAILEVWQKVISGIKSAYNGWLQALWENEQYERLYRIVNNVTGASREQIEVLNDQSKALASLWVVSSWSITQVQSQLATFDLQIETIKKLTPAVLDYVTAEKWANATTEEFKQATNGLAQALNGNFWSLTRVWFVLDENTKKQISNGTEMERAEAIVKVLQSTYGWFNQALAETPLGKIQNLNNRFNDLKDTLFNNLTPAFSRAIEVIWNFFEILEDPKDVISKYENKIENTETLMDTLEQAYIDWRISIEDYEFAIWQLNKNIDWYNKKIDETWNNQKTFTRTLVDNFKSMVSTIWNFFKSFWLLFAWMVLSFITWLTAIWEGVWQTIWFIQSNFSVLANNAKVIVSKVWQNILSVVDNISSWIASLINTTIKGLNKLPWVSIKWQVEWTSFAKKINPWEFQELQNNFNLKATKEFASKTESLFKKSWEAFWDAFKKWTESGVNEALENWKKLEDILNKTKSWLELDWWDSWNWAWWKLKSEKEALKELEKLKKEEEKKEKEREERFQDFLKNKAKKTLETTKETYERISDYLKDNIKKFEKNIDDFDKAIKKSQESIDDLSEDLKKLESWKSSDLSNRYLWTISDIQKLQDEIKKLEQKWVNLRDAESYWLNTLKQIWTWFIWNNTVEDLLEILEKQKKLNDLLKEQNLLRDNLSQEQIDEALRKDGLSETEKILEEYEAEKESLNQQIQLEKEYIEEVQWLRDIEIENLENFNEIKENLDLKYADFAMQLEAKITQQQYEQLSKREANLNASIDRQISKLNEMIRIANNAWISLAWTNLWDSTSKSTSSWSSNTTIVNNTFNQNISDNIDMNRVNKEIVNTMNSNSKWMSWRTI